MIFWEGKRGDMIIKDNKQPPVINLDKSARFLVVEKNVKMSTLKMLKLM